MTRNAIAATFPWLVPTPADHKERRSTYLTLGKRDTLCRQCGKHFRKADVEGGICAWCEYENKEGKTI
jgi:predicted amidophosphoribosyltransferase